MKTLLVLIVLMLAACSDSTAPAIDCQGELQVDIHVRRMYTDTTVVCAFPRDTTPPEPPEPPCDDDDEGHHGHDHHHHGGHR